MAHQRLRILELPELAHEIIFKQCELEDLIRFSSISQRAKKTMRNARIAITKLEITSSCFINVTLNNYSKNEVYWLFEEEDKEDKDGEDEEDGEVEQEDGEDEEENQKHKADQADQADKEDKEAQADFNFDALWSATRFREDSDLEFSSRCSDSNKAIGIVLHKLKKLFPVQNVPSLDFEIHEGQENLEDNPVLQELTHCQELKLHLHSDASPIPRKHLDWLFENISIDEFVFEDFCSTIWNYRNPMGNIRTLHFRGLHDSRFLTPMNFENATHVHFHSGTRSINKINNLLKSWQRGLFPNLQILEHRDCSEHFINWQNMKYMEQLMDKLENVREWDKTREETFNMHEFSRYANLKVNEYHQRNERPAYREGKDISNRNKTQGTIIPNSEHQSFVFVVWSEWIPEEFRKPSDSEPPFYED